MKKGLFDIEPLKEAPQEPAGTREAARSYREELENRQRAEDLKKSIAQQIDKGNAPQCILYTALQVIGLLSGMQWAQDQQQKLDNVYSDLAQQSFITDNEATAAHRLEEMQQQYNSKLKRQLKRNLAEYRKIEKGISEALKAIEEMEPEEDFLK